MSVPDIYKSKDWVKDKALITTDDYEKLYSQSITDPISFWGEQGNRLDWYAPYTKIRDYSYNKNNLYIKWYEDGICLLYTSPSPRDKRQSRMPSSA